MFDADNLKGRMALWAAGATGLARRLEPHHGGCGAVLWLHDGSGLQDADPASTVAKIGKLAESLRGQGFEFVGMDEAVARLAETSPKARFLALAAECPALATQPALPEMLDGQSLPIALYVSPGLFSGQADPWREIVRAAVISGKRIRIETEQGAIVLDTAGKGARKRAHQALIAWLSNDVAELSIRDAVRRLAMECGVDIGVLRRKHVPGWDSIRTLAAHPMVTLGALPMRNLRLRRLGEAAAHSEVSDSLAAIALETGMTPRHFSLAAGDGNFAALGLPLGLQSVLTDRTGMLHAGEDPSSLPRMSVSLGDLDPARLRTRLTGIGDAWRGRFRKA